MTKKISKHKWRFMTDDGEVTYAYVDGYDFGDTLLEGVLFIVKIKVVTFKIDGVADDAVEYMKNMNMKKWSKAALDFCKDNDIFIAPDRKSDAWVLDENGKENPHIKSDNKSQEVKTWKEFIEKGDD